MAGILAVVVGLTLLALGSGREGREYAPAVFHWALLATTALMLLLTLILVRRAALSRRPGWGCWRGWGSG